MILVVNAANFREASCALELRFITTSLKDVFKEKRGKAAANEGHEEGFAPNILENKEAPELLQCALGKANDTTRVIIGIYLAASQFFRPGKYDLDFKSPDGPSRYIWPCTSR